MGLSRKLGGGGASSPRDVVRSDVDYTWSTQAYTMRDILTRFQLPCVVQCAGDAGTVLWSHFRFDMRQPLLLHAARTVRKVHARSLKPMGNQYGQLEEFGPPLAIPEDYDGWFFPVGRKDPTVLPRHTRVEGVAASPCRRFLVTTSLPAFTPAKGAGSGGPSSSKNVQHEVSIGEVLTKMGVVKSDTLRCMDENKHEVLLPFNHRALLYDVDDNFGVPATNTATTGAPTAAPPSSTSGVVHTRTIVNAGNKSLPRVFRHVLGELPALSHAFTGIMRCYTVFTEETVMAATMSRTNLNSTSVASSSSSACLELATDSSAKFNIALNASELKKTKQYSLALKTCEEQAPSYVRAIKASFTVQPVLCGDGSGGDDRFNLALYQGVDVGRGQENEALGKSSPQTEVSKQKETTQGKSPPASASAKTTAEADIVDFHSKVGSRVPAGERALVPGEFRDDVRDDVESVQTTSDDNMLDDEAESVLTDDVDVDTASQSDATDIASEVEANSEFHFAWGQLKRARAYSGSISSLTNSDTASSSTNTDDDDDDNFVLDHGDESNHSSLNSSIRSSDSTVTRGTNSSAGTLVTNSGTNSSKGTTSSNSSAPSVDTVVLRASAPSPVYANVPKKGEGLSVFHSPDQDECGVGTAGSVRSDPIAASSLTAERGREKEQLLRTPDRPFHDSSVRSVWNVTPTIDDVKNLSRCRHDDLPRVLGIEGDSEGDAGEGVPPLWWGDTDNDVTADTTNPELLLDSDEAILRLHNHHRQPAESSFSGSSSLEHRHQTSSTGNHHLPVAIAAFTTDAAPQCLQNQQSSSSARSSLSNQGCNAIGHPTLSATSSSSATDSSASTVILDRKPPARSRAQFSSTLSAPPSHAPLSAMSSTHSEGSVQDLAIQRLERALNDATNFLKTGGTAALAPVPVSPAPATPGLDVPRAAGPNVSLSEIRPDISGSSSVTEASQRDPSSLLARPLPLLPGNDQRRSSTSSSSTTATDPVPAPRRGRKIKAAESLQRDNGSFSSPEGSNTPRGSSRRNSSHKVADDEVASAPLDRNCGSDGSGRHGISSQASPRFASTSVFTPSAFKPLPRGQLIGGTRNLGPKGFRQGRISRYQSDSNIYVDLAAQRHSANRRQSYPAVDNQTGNNEDPPHYKSDSTLSDAQPAFCDLTVQRGSNGQICSLGHSGNGAQQGEEQIDLEFVKTLGDRLLAVSRKSTLPKYQRLYHENDHLADGEENQDGRYQFQKKKQKASSRMMSHVTNASSESDNSGDSFSQKLESDAKLADLDLLHEEVV